MSFFTNRLKNTPIFCVLFFILCLSSTKAQNCPEGTLTFVEPGELEEFRQKYPNCTSFNGTIIIQHFITNLRPLSNLRSIAGTLQIKNCKNLSSLAGLENLREIRGDLFIFQCDKLKSFKELQNLSRLGGLKLDANPSFENFEGLEKIKLIEGLVFINGNPSLNSFKGLNNLSLIGKSFNIRYNDDLQHLQDLHSLKEIGNLEIAHNEELFDLEGLESLEMVNGSFNINYNERINAFCGLDNLKEIDLDMNVLSNPLLQKLDGMNNLSKVGKNLSIQFNERLTSINGLSNLNENFLWKLTVRSNRQLNACDIPLVCRVIENRVYHDIQLNGRDCSSTDGLRQSCSDAPTNVVNTDSDDIEYVNDRVIIGDKVFESSTEIESNSYIFYGADVAFRATEAINLVNDFRVNQNADFIAEITESDIVTPTPEPTPTINNSCN